MLSGLFLARAHVQIVTYARKHSLSSATHCPCDKVLRITAKSLSGVPACKWRGGYIRMQEGYDDSYFFISSFIADHINYHADALGTQLGLHNREICWRL